MKHKQLEELEFHIFQFHKLWILFNKLSKKHLEFCEKKRKPSRLFNYYKRMTYKYPFLWRILFEPASLYLVAATYR